jgi:SAM-dependent methyltransferase
LSAGGALGGIFVGLLAPALFADFFELKIAMSACFVLGLRFLFGYRSKPFLLICGLLAIVSLRTFEILDSRSKSFEGRNFYGVLSIRQAIDDAGNKLRVLFHGVTAHGGQLLTPGLRGEPTFYYGRKSGVGLALQRPISGHRVGIVGLGAGTLAAYGNAGDYYRFYELNPLVTQLAFSQFTFLRDSRAHVDIAPGDARLSLEHEPKQQFDTLVLDAFSGDSIPVHLLTREAFQCYFRHLKNDGILAVHVSNQYLDLRPVVADIASNFGKQALYVLSAAEPKRGTLIAAWILVTADRPFLERLASAKRGEFLPPSRHRLWTDQYSNVLGALR